jgi:outer membrane protein assembly factor BamB
VTGSFADGTPISIMSSFERATVVPIVRNPNLNWPMFRNGPAGSSFVAHELTPPLELAWSTPSAGLVALNSPVVANGTVYFGSRPERDVIEAGVMACDAETGAVDWFTHLPGGVALAPAVAGGVVLATAITGSVYGLDAATGQLLWSTASPVSRYHMTAPVFSGDVAWVGAEPRPLQIEWATGAVDWQTDPLGGDWFPYIYSGPAVGANYVYFGFYGVSPLNQGGLAIVDRATGGRVWVDEGAFRSPIWTGAILYVVGDADKNNQKLTARDELGAISWTSPVNFGNGTGSPALAHDVVVVAGRDGTIEGVSATDGASLWSHPVGPELYHMVSGIRDASGTMGTPAITGRVAYVGSLDGYLYALDLDAGTELWKWYFGTPVASSPAVSGNMLFVGASDGHLYAFQSTTPPAGTSVETSGLGASVFTFYPPRPNPSSAATQFSWVMPARGTVRLAIHDVGGRRVRTLVDEERDAGEDFAVWDGRDRHGRPVASGIYFARLVAGPDTVVKKLVRLRR